MTAMKRRLALVALLSGPLSGCAGSGRPAAQPKLQPAKPEAVEALKDAARLVRLGQGSYGRALDKLKEAQQLDPRLWEAHYDEGWLELERHHLETAVAALKRASAIYPAHLPTVLALGRAHGLLGRSSEAVKVYRAYLDRRPDEGVTEVRVALGSALRKSGKLPEAIEAFREVLRAAPRSIAALNGLGLVYQEKGQFELADLVLHRALEIDQKSKAAAETWNNLGLVALGRRRDQEAFAAFDQASKLNPQLTVARRNKAVVYLDCGDYARAAEELTQVVQSDADDAEAFVALGVAERGRGAFDAAEKAFLRALDVDPQTVDARFDLGVLFMDFKKDARNAKDKAKAQLEEFLRAASSKHPKRAEAESRLKELAPKPSPAASSTKGGGA
jgi:tetratricopeptide (TPR) repeat protein